MSEQSLRGVCVGAGYFSRFQDEAWRRIPEVEIVANCNRSLERAETIASEFGVAKSYVYEDFSAMLDAEKPDFVDIGGKSAGAVSGTMNMAGNIGSFVTSLAFPYLAAWFGSTTPFFYIAAGLNALAIFLWLGMRPDCPLMSESRATT